MSFDNKFTFRQLNVVCILIANTPLVQYANYCGVELLDRYISLVVQGTSGGSHCIFFASFHILYVSCTMVSRTPWFL